MRKFKSKLIIHLIMLITIYSPASKIKQRQIIVYNAPLYLRPGVKVKELLKTGRGRRVYRKKRYKLYIKGGNLINVKSTVFYKGNKYLKFNFRNNRYYIKKKYTGEKPLDIKPSVAFETGKEKFDKPVPFHYEPADLKRVNVYTAPGKNIYLRKNAASSFISMAIDAEKKGIKLVAVKGYVSVGMYAKYYLKQRKIWGVKYNPRKIMRPGKHCMHSGVFVDVSSRQNRYIADDHFAYTKAYKWLISNSQYYGFHFTDFTNPLDYRCFRLRYTGKTSLIFKMQKPVYYKNVFKNESVILKKFYRKGIDVKYLVIHDNENTATRAMKYALKKYGGSAVELVNRLKLNYRNIIIPTKYKKLEVDPNRIFTDFDALRDMRMWNDDAGRKSRKKALKNIRRIRNAILKSVNMKNRRYLIAVHTNKRYGNLSINSFYKRSIRRRYYLYKNRRMHKKSFLYVISKKDFDYFKSRNINVACPKKWDGKDGSLAFVAMRKKTPYITIESAEGNDLMQRKILDAVMSLVKKRLASWGKAVSE